MKKRNLLLTVLALSLVAVISIGVTLAVLTDKTDPAVNHFTMTQNGIQIALREPTWDNENFPGEASPGIEEAKLGQTLAQDFLPLSQIPKDPTVKNTGGHDAWVAITLEYTWDNEASVPMADRERVAFEALAEQVDFTVDASKWMVKDSTTRAVYYYNTKLAAGEKTTPLFTTVSIKNVEEIHNFDIIVKAFAVQGDNVSFEQAQETLDALIASAG